MSNEDSQIAVRFTTKLPEEYQIPDAPLTVPGSYRRAALSKVVNHLLELADPRPFDFLVEGKLLRQSLQEHFIENSLSVEGVVEVEYILVVLPPKKQTTAVHDDWIRSVSCSEANGFLSASYDGTVKCWNENLEHLWTLCAHTDPVVCVTHVPSTDPVMFLTASQDQTVKAWILEKPNTIPKQLATLISHTDSISNVVSSPEGNFCCSVGWDAQTYIWSCGTSLKEAKTDPTLLKKHKRQKTNTVEEPVKTIGSLGQFTGHQGCISGVVWPIQSTLYTSGWDHTVKQWDFQTGLNFGTFTSSRVIHCLAASSRNPSLVAFGSADGILRFWDSREKHESASLKLYRSHRNWISSVQWALDSDLHLVTGSYDYTIRIWDIRGTVPLGSCPSHQDKVLAVDWASDKSILSGGADCALQLHEVDLSLQVNCN